MLGRRVGERRLNRVVAGLTVLFEIPAIKVKISSETFRKGGPSLDLHIKLKETCYLPMLAH